jgi:hypothetical protein
LEPPAKVLLSLPYVLAQYVPAGTLVLAQVAYRAIL